MNHNKNNGLIEILNTCISACSYCAIACLEEEDVNMLKNCIKLNLDCADICGLAVSLLARSSAHAIIYWKSVPKYAEDVRMNVKCIETWSIVRHVPRCVINVRKHVYKQYMFKILSIKSKEMDELSRQEKKMLNALASGKLYKELLLIITSL